MARKSTAEEIMEMIRGLSAMLPLWAASLLVPAVGIAVFLLIETFIFSFFRKYVPDLDSNTSILLAFMAMALAALAVYAGQMERRKRRANFSKTQKFRDLRDLNWREFEMLVADAYRKTGYQVIERGGSVADGGVDLEVVSPDGRRGIVQCKQWKTQSVGVKVVREMLGVMQHQQASFVVIVTCGGFTMDAKALAWTFVEFGFAAGEAIYAHFEEVGSLGEVLSH